MAKRKRVQRKRPARVAVAIDLGATRSGFAYAFAADRRIVTCNLWPDQPRAYPKTSGHLLYGPRRQLLAWGYPAVRRHAELVAAGKGARHDLFTGAHQVLAEAGVRTTQGPSAQRRGRNYPVIEVWAESLRALQEMALRTLNAATADEIHNDDVLWSLTVPPDWKPRHQELLPKAARRAGLIGGRAADSERLVLVSPTDAIVVHCQEADGHVLVPGNRLVVVDAGGGAIRVGAYRMNQRRTLTRLDSSTPERIPGAARIDQAFVEGFLHDKLGVELLAAYRGEEPVDFYEVLVEWERLKCHFDPTTSLGASYLPYRPRLLRLLMTRFPKIYERLTAAGHDDGFYLEPTDMEALFEPVIAATIGGVRRALREAQLRKADFLYLVGGLAGSPLFRQRLESELGPRFQRIVVPSVPGAAAMEGAVSYSFQPQVARQRRSRVTYGCGCEMPLDPPRDGDERKVFCDDLDGWYCRQRFLPFVKAGEIVEPGHQVTHVLSPMTRLQEEILLDLYASRDADVRYLDEDSVRKIGELRVKLPDSFDVDREVEIVMTFGDATLEVRARGRGTDRGRRLTLPFSTSFSTD
jgi:hypothetical protein